MEQNYRKAKNLQTTGTAITLCSILGLVITYGAQMITGHPSPTLFILVLTVLAIVGIIVAFVGISRLKKIKNSKEIK